MMMMFMMMLMMMMTRIMMMRLLGEALHRFEEIRRQRELVTEVLVETN